MNGNHYQFREHGIPTRITGVPYPNYSSNRISEDPTDNEPIIAPDEIRLNTLVHPKELYLAFHKLKKEKGLGVGRDRLSYRDYSESECRSMIRELSSAIKNRTYRPSRTRQVTIPKPDGGQRELELQCIPDRLIAYLLQNVFRPFFNSILPGLTQTVPILFARWEQVIETEGKYIFDEQDIQNCFPSAPIDPTLECHRHIINNEEILWLIETVIRGYEGQNRTTGLCQGSPYSPVALELLLHNHLDSRFTTEYRGSRDLLRYVDNLLIVSNNELDCRQATQFMEDCLSEIELILKHNENHPMDIRENTERVILGMIPRWQDRKLHLTIPENAFLHLETGLNEATISRYPTQHATAVAKGWISAYGPALVNQAVREVVDRVYNTCRHTGFLLNRRKLSTTARRAHQKWQEIRRQVRTPSGN